jgi:hypothetical protein
MSTNQKLSDAIIEAYATAPSNLIYLDTLQVTNPGVETLWLVNDRIDQTFTLENGARQLFSSCGFRFNLPGANADGLQTLNLSIDNVDRRPTDFVRTVLQTLQPVQITYRPYISTDFTRPQMNPPLVLFLTDIQVTAAEVSGTANFANLANANFLGELYNSIRFPGLPAARANG